MVQIAVEHDADSIERLLRLIRAHLEMEVVGISMVHPGERVPVAVDGDGPRFDLEVGRAYELAGTWCNAVLDGRLPCVIPDTSLAEIQREAPLEPADPRAFVAVPVRFSSGRLWGILCATSRGARQDLDEAEAAVVRLAARLIAEELERAELEERARQATSVRTFLVALAARDDYTGMHTTQVVDLVEAVARRMGLAERDVAFMRDVAMLHDVGKIAIPDAVLKKPAPLADWEWQLIREHPAIGARMVQAVSGTAHLAAAIRAEHERWDGSGYPDGLAREEIPLASRVILACDAYDAMVTRRPYRKPLQAADALSELRRGAGSQFDPEVVEVLLEILAAGQTQRANGEMPVHPPAAKGHAVLTARQREVLSYIAGGFSTAQAAAALYISPETAATHVRDAIERLGARTRSHAVAIAIRSGELIEPGPDAGPRPRVV